MMKLTLCELRTLIREAASNDLALLLSGRRSSQSFTLYKPSQAKRAIEALKNDKTDDQAKNDLIKSIVAMIDTDQQGKYYVANTMAAERGYGHIVFDVASYYLGGLALDRDHITPAAKEMFNRYESRKDVVLTPLPENLWKHGGDLVLDAIIVVTNDPGIDEMISAHEQFEASFGPTSPGFYNTKSFLQDAGGEFFMRKHPEQFTPGERTKMG